MGINHVNSVRAVLLQQVAHAVLALAAEEIAVHAVDDLKPRVLADHVHEPPLPVPHRRGVRRPADLNDLHLFRACRVRFAYQVFPGPASLCIEIRADISCVQTVILRFDHPIHQDHRDPRLLCFCQHVVPSGLHNWRKHDHVYPVCNKGTDGINLLFLLLIGVFHHQAVAGFLRCLLHAGCICYPPGAFCPQLGKSDHDRGAVRRCFLLPRASAQSRQQQNRKH